jgi:hypothetical protein
MQTEPVPSRPNEHRETTVGHGIAVPAAARCYPVTHAVLPTHRTGRRVFRLRLVRLSHLHGETTGSSSRSGRTRPKRPKVHSIASVASVAWTGDRRWPRTGSGGPVTQSPEPTDQRENRRLCRFCRLACPTRIGRDPRQEARDTLRVPKRLVVRDGTSRDRKVPLGSVGSVDFVASVAPRVIGANGSSGHVIKDHRDVSVRSLRSRDHSLAAE